MRNPSQEPAAVYVAGKSPAGFKTEQTRGRTCSVCPSAAPDLQQLSLSQ